MPLAEGGAQPSGSGCNPPRQCARPPGRCMLATGEEHTAAEGGARGCSLLKKEPGEKKEREKKGVIDILAISCTMRSCFCQTIYQNSFSFIERVVREAEA